MLENNKSKFDIIAGEELIDELASNEQFVTDFTNVANKIVEMFGNEQKPKLKVEKYQTLIPIKEQTIKREKIIVPKTDNPEEFEEVEQEITITTYNPTQGTLYAFFVDLTVFGNVNREALMQFNSITGNIDYTANVQYMYSFAYSTNDIDERSEDGGIPES